MGKEVIARVIPDGRLELAGRGRGNTLVTIGFSSMTAALDLLTTLAHVIEWYHDAALVDAAEPVA